MTMTHFKPLAVTLGLALLPVACLAPSTSTTEGAETDTDGTTGDATTGDASNATPATATDTPTSTPTTGDEATDDSTATEPTTATTGDDTTTGTPEAMCGRLGDVGGIGELVSGFLGVVVADERINGYFLNQDVDTGHLATMVSAQLGEVAGCEGVTYEGMSMKDAHAGMGISAQDFLDFVNDFQVALDAHGDAHPGLTDDDRAMLMSALGGFEADIVEDPENNLTMYQRVGRKPGIKALVGGPDEMASFLGLVLADEAINTFFAMAMHDRFATCLTRQIGDIDGPIEYGAEVDSPAPGVDPGVGIGDECRDMAAVHENLQDEAMTYITVDDFGAFLGDLIQAMGFAGIAEGDQTVILDGLGPLCDQIVVGSEEKNKCPGNSKQDLVELTALAQPLLDDAYDGTLESMLCNDVIVAEDADGIELVSAVELKLGLDHPWIGDLTVKLQSPGGAVLTLFNRPGNEVLPDDGTECCADNSDFSKDFPIVLKNGGMFDAAKMGTTIAADKIVCKDDKQCEFMPNHGMGPGVDFSDFLGETAAGTWKVCIGDSNPDDFGTLDYLGLTFTKVKYDPKL